MINPKISLIDKIYEKESESKESPIIDIKSAQPYPIFILSSKLDALMQKQQKLLIEVKDSLCLSLIPHKDINIQKMRAKIILLTVRSTETSQLSHYHTKRHTYSKQDVKDALKVLKNLEEVQRKIKIYEASMERLRRLTMEIKGLFITFKYRSQRDHFFRVLPSSRFQSWIKSYENYKIGGRRIYLIEPPSPININWWNLDMSGFDKFLRRFVSWFLYIILFFIRKFKSLRTIIKKDY